MIISEERQFHINTTASDIGKYVLLPGDPGRVELIAKYLDNPKFITSKREFTTYTGSLLGIPVTVTSTGIGGPSAAIAIEELIKCGAHTFIRVGTCGGMNINVVGGDLVIAKAAIRGDGTSLEYLPPEYPATADTTVTSAIIKSAADKSTNDIGNSYHVGTVQSKDAFYAQHEPESMPVKHMLNQRWKSYIDAGCLASEMEAATLFCVGIVRNVRVGALFTAMWNQSREEAGLENKRAQSNERAIITAIDAIKLLIEED